jgi:SAM-dependent methyltransferase
VKNPFQHRPIERNPASFDEADEGLVAALQDLEQAENYSAWILELVSPHVSGRILEVGAGRGTYSTHFAERGKLTALEPSEAQSAALREQLDGAVAPGSYDTVILLNVLEHIPDDRQALHDIHNALAPGGKLILWVPAFEALYGDFDRRIGHYRRYRRDDLAATVRKVGFQTVNARYTNLPGFFAWWLVVRVLGKTPTVGRLTVVYDRVVVPVVRRVERRIRPPFGQSVMVVAQRV